MATQQSPRIENNVIKWYEGDVFYLSFDFINENTNAPIELIEGDSFEIDFFNGCRLIKTIKITEKTNGLYLCYIDERTTRLFTVGEYSYTVQYIRNNGELKQTIENCGKCIVEGVCKCRT